MMTLYKESMKASADIERKYVIVPRYCVDTTKFERGLLWRRRSEGFYGGDSTESWVYYKKEPLEV